jgi:hypothetical protein
MKYVTFYTEGFYEGVYKQYVKPSAEKFNLDLKGYREHNYRDWNLNTRTKAKVVLRALHAFEEIVWLDADAELVKYPELFDSIPQEYDVAMFYLDWWKHWHNEEGNLKRELVNSVMMLRNRPNVCNLIEQWIEANITSRVCDQPILEEVLRARDDIKVFELPVQYCAIMNHQDELPDYIKDPVIVQHQISRKVKHDKTLLQ